MTIHGSPPFLRYSSFLKAWKDNSPGMILHSVNLCCSMDEWNTENLQTVFIKLDYFALTVFSAHEIPRSSLGCLAESRLPGLAGPVEGFLDRFRK